jgi:hypothetical protein
MRILLPLLALLALTLSGCKDVGDACEVTGDGFTRRDPCAGACLSWAITCPDGRSFTPDECAGSVCGEDGTCPDGQMCLQIDSFAANSRCVRASLCEE